MLPELAPASARRPRARGRLRRALTGLVAVAVVGSLLAIGGEPSPATALSGHIQGTVFRDFNQNGIFDQTVGADGLTDAPLKGVTATAYAASGATVGSAVTNAAGVYDITVGGGLSDGAAVRIQFSGYPASFTDSMSGTANASSVQFTTVGATGVNFALHKTTDYSRGTTGTPLITAIQGNGSPALSYGTAGLNAAVRNVPALTAVLPSAAVYTASPTITTSLATFQEIGAVWGIAMQPLGPTTGGDRYYIYAAAVTKRHSDWGPRGIDGLYRLDVTVSSSGAVTRNGLTSYDLGVGGVNYGVVNVTATTTTGAQGARDLADRNTGLAGVQSLDTGAYAAAGKVGIGGIAYHEGYLYVVNLNDKQIWRYNVANFAAAPVQIALGATNALIAQERPWALTVHEGALYLGVTHDTTLAVSGTNPPRGGAKVLRVPLAGGSSTVALTVPLNYSRGIAWLADDPVTTTTQQAPAQWHNWRDDYGNLYTNATLVTYFRAWAQPILSGLAFDDGGNLSLGLIDRFSYQTGVDALWPTSYTAWQSGTINALPIGDVLFAGRGADGALAIENLGTAAGAGVPATTAGLDVVSRVPGYGAEGAVWGQPTRQNFQHGGLEFFEDSVGYNGAGRIVNNEGVVHDETALGAVATIAGSNQLTTTSFDAARTYNAAGNRFLSLIDGHSINGFDQYLPGVGYFGKNGGIGGVAFLLDEAPVEIGNRVWYDADGDGIQDPDEPAINGAPVELWTADASGNPVTLLASTQTATLNGQDGTYYFRSVDAPSGGIAGFVKDADYVVVFPSRPAVTPVDLRWPSGTASSVQTMFTGLTWGQMVRTTQAAGGDRLVDSNPAVATGRALVSVGGMGENDHSLDAGWVGFSTFRLEKAVVGSPPAGAEYTFTVGSATNFRGDDRLWTAGPATPLTVDTLEYVLTAGQTITSTETLPYGYTLTVTEDGATPELVAFTPNTGGGSDDTGRLVISPTSTSGGQLLRATNSYTSITVTKALAPTAALPPGTTFPVEYTVDGGPVQSVQVAVGAPVTIDGIPFGASVELREPLDGPFSWGGYAWAAGTWSQGATALPTDADGWITVTAPTSTTALALTLTNHPYLPPALPFAGGMSADAFTIAGAAAVLLALALGAWQLRARRSRRTGAAHRA